MHTQLLAAALTAILTLPACSNSGTNAAKSENGAVVAGAEARRLVERGATLLDVRTEQEFGDEHLPEAVNVPVDELAARLGEVPQQRPVVVYCRSGGRSARAARILVTAGYQVHDLGPIDAW